MIDLAKFTQGLIVQEPGHQISTQEQTRQDFQPWASPCLILGAQGTGKTSVLFQYALQSAAEGQQVIFITPTLRHCPLLSAQMDHESPELVESLRRISMKYIDTHQKLRLYVTSLHRMAHRPDILVIDGLSTICQRDQIPREILSKELRNTLAMLQNASETGWDGAPAIDLLLATNDEAGDDSGHLNMVFINAARLVLRLSGAAPLRPQLVVEKSSGGPADPLFFSRPAMYCMEQSALLLVPRVVAGDAAAAE